MCEGVMCVGVMCEGVMCEGDMCALPSQTWLVLFPEGTRFSLTNQIRIEKSQEYARSLGMWPP